MRKPTVDEVSALASMLGIRVEKIDVTHGPGAATVVDTWTRRRLTFPSLLEGLILVLESRESRMPWLTVERVTMLSKVISFDWVGFYNRLDRDVRPVDPTLRSTDPFELAGLAIGWIVFAQRYGDTDGRERQFDNCWESGKGYEVQRWFVLLVGLSREWRAAAVSYFGEEAWARFVSQSRVGNEELLALF